MRIYMHEVRALGLGCEWGALRMAKRYGLDLKGFLANGIDASALLATGDAQLAEIVAAVRRARGEAA